MKTTLMILSACLLPLGLATAGPGCCKSKCASGEKAKTVAKSECCENKCDKAECCEDKCDKTTATATAGCTFKCEKSAAKLFESFDKDKDGKLSKDEFMALVKAATAKPEAKAEEAKEADKASAAN